MKNYLLIILTLMIAGCGIYLWANSISKKERLELLNGEYELVDWQIRPKSAIHADSLTVHDVPQRGERLTLQTNDNGDFRLTTESSLPVLQQLADLEWQLHYVNVRGLHGDIVSLANIMQENNLQRSIGIVHLLVIQMWALRYNYPTLRMNRLAGY